MIKHLNIIPLLAIMLACQPKASKDTASEKSNKEDIGVSLTRVWESDTSLVTPESVLFDSTRNVLYVSCINGVPPDAKDEDGYIARISPADGSVIELKWVNGLHAPKGMGLYNDKLYVTNIDELVEIDVASGTITERYPVEEAVFLNDVTVDANGDVYFSDSNTNKIHRLSGGEVTTWLEDSTMGGPNGLFHDGEKLMIATFGSGNFYAIDFTDQQVDPVVDSIAGGDGVVKVGVDFLVSNWNGEVYYVTSDWEKEKILDTKEIGSNAADIEFIPATNTLLVPTFFGNQVVAYELVRE